jgi:GDP-L-fucose synthase
MTKRILVTGGSGMVGHALKDIIPEALFLSSKQCDLRNKEKVDQLFHSYRPQQVIHLAARVGGVGANMRYMGDFYHDNIRINTNVLASAHEYGAEKVLSLLSTCIYPKKISYPLAESQIHNGEPHDTNFAYAYSKRMLDVQSRAYRQQYGCNFVTLVPNNLFGENDNYHLQDSHVIPAIMHKILLAKQTGGDVILWGDGSPLREFTYSGDLAKIILLLLDSYNEAAPINVGNGVEYTIKEVAMMLAHRMKFEGKIVWDSSMPAGQLRKPSDSGRLSEYGWQPSDYTPFIHALEKSCDWFLEKYPNVRGVL